MLPKRNRLIAAVLLAGLVFTAGGTLFFLPSYNLQKRAEQSIADGRTTSLLFTEDWCSTCVKQKPIYDTVTAEFSDVDFYVLDSKQYLPLKKAHGIVGLPTIIIFKNGKESRRIIGSYSADELRDALSK